MTKTSDSKPILRGKSCGGGEPTPMLFIAIWTVVIIGSAVGFAHLVRSTRNQPTEPTSETLRCIGANGILCCPALSACCQPERDFNLTKQWTELTAYQCNTEPACKHLRPVNATDCRPSINNGYIAGLVVLGMVLCCCGVNFICGFCMFAIQKLFTA